MKSPSPHHNSGRPSRWLVIATATLAGLAPLRAADAAPATTAPAAGSAPAAAAGANVTAIDRADFSLKFPANWKENTKDGDYDANSNFTIQDPKKQSYIEFHVLSKTAKPEDILKTTLQGIEGLGITVLEKTPIDEWGSLKGVGTHLKGKILDTDPGGIKAFVLTSEHHNVLILEFYYSAEMKDVSSDIDFVSQNFAIKN